VRDFARRYGHEFAVRAAINEALAKTDDDFFWACSCREGILVLIRISCNWRAST
jgi:hypothetical protein